MEVRIWGARGSSPTPISPEEIRGKISSVIQRVHPSDLIDAKSREQFLAHLPSYLFGTIGGNTACVSALSSDGVFFIFDCGTGLKELESHLRKTRSPIREFHIFLSHFHYDHLLGLPYFTYFYDPSVKIVFYSPYPKMEIILKQFLSTPYHPVDFSSFKADISFEILEGHCLQLNPELLVSWKKRNHPNGSFAYKVSQGGKHFIYSTDTELVQKDFIKTLDNLSFFEGVDLIILDAQYTLEESFEKYDWGHSSYSIAIDFALEFNIPSLYLFHHEPNYNDKKMASILRSARWYAQRSHRDRKIFIDLAKEGDLIIL